MVETSERDSTSPRGGIFLLKRPHLDAFSFAIYTLQLLGLVTLFLLPNTILVLKPMAKVLVLHE